MIFMVVLRMSIMGRHKDTDHVFRCDKCGKLQGQMFMCLTCSGINPMIIYFDIPELTTAICFDCCDCEVENA